jgi:hypothetical protein
MYNTVNNINLLGFTGIEQERSLKGTQGHKATRHSQVFL